MSGRQAVKRTLIAVGLAAVAAMATFAPTLARYVKMKRM